MIVGIFRRITDHFRSGELAFNDYGRIGWVSRLAIKLYPQKMFKDVGSQFGLPGLQGRPPPADLESADASWSRRPAWSTPPRSTCFPAGYAIATKLSGRSKTGRRKARILRYSF